MVRRACAYTKRLWWNPLAEMHMIWHPKRLFSTELKKISPEMAADKVVLFWFPLDLLLQRWPKMIDFGNGYLKNDRDKVSPDIVIRSTCLPATTREVLGQKTSRQKFISHSQTQKFTLLVSLYRESDKLRWRLLFFLEVASSKGILPPFLDRQHLWSRALGFGM